MEGFGPAVSRGILPKMLEVLSRGGLAAPGTEGSWSRK